MSNLLQRVIFAVIAIPIVLYIVLYKPLGFFTLTVILSGVTVWEYYGLAKTKGYSPQVGLGIFLTMCTAMIFGIERFTFGYGSNISQAAHEIVISIAGLSAFIILASELFRALPNPIEQSAITLFGPIYIGIGCGTLFGLFDLIARNPMIAGADKFTPGYFVIVLLVSIWVCDSAAYFAGKAFGKHKLFERVSPNKTWEGSIAGFICCVAVWVLVPKIFPELGALKTTNALIIGIIVGNVGQLGDLAKSLLKRDAGVKDSSNLIPGHGGFLDRLDSIMFSAPILYAVLNVISTLQ